MYVEWKSLIREMILQSIGIHQLNEMNLNSTIKQIFNWNLHAKGCLRVSPASVSENANTDHFVCIFTWRNCQFIVNLIYTFVLLQ